MTRSLPAAGLAAASATYLSFLEDWMAGLPPVECEARSGAMLVVDVIEGFCEHGSLASPRVDEMVSPLVALLNDYSAMGGRAVLLPEDSHPEDAREFVSFPPHCITGTSEARTVERVLAVERDGWRHYPKQTINGLAEPELGAAVRELLAVGIEDFVVVGDCTDLCIYQAAVGLQLLLNRSENAQYRKAHVIVPASAVETYDLAVDAAAAIGAQPHPADLLHAVFLHHMALNGITVVDTVRWR